MGSDSLSNHIRLLALGQRRPHFFLFLPGSVLLRQVCLRMLFCLLTKTLVINKLARHLVETRAQVNAQISTPSCRRGKRNDAQIDRRRCHVLSSCREKHENL